MGCGPKKKEEEEEIRAEFLTVTWEGWDEGKKNYAKNQLPPCPLVLKFINPKPGDSQHTFSSYSPSPRRPPGKLVELSQVFSFLSLEKTGVGVGKPCVLHFKTSGGAIRRKKRKGYI